MNTNAKNLASTIKDFNHFAEIKHDYAFERDADTLTAFDDGPYYALAMVQGLLNTQGGPVHNAKAEVVDNDNAVIPHLYAIGELGSLMGRQYNGGSNLAENLVFGKIAGENAASEKPIIQNSETKVDAETSASIHKTGLGSDVVEEHYETKANQYIGKSTAGMGNEIVVRVTANSKDDIQDIEILKQSESDDYGLKAVKQLPKEIVAKNSVDVDTVSGASASSKAIKEAVTNALKQI